MEGSGEWLTVSLRFVGPIGTPTADQLQRLDAALHAVDADAPSIAEDLYKFGRDWQVREDRLTPEQFAALLHREGFACQYRSWPVAAPLRHGWCEPVWLPSGGAVRVSKRVLWLWDEVMSRPDDLSGEETINGGPETTLAEYLAAHPWRDKPFRPAPFYYPTADYFSCFFTDEEAYEETLLPGLLDVFRSRATKQIVGCRVWGEWLRDWVRDQRAERVRSERAECVRVCNEEAARWRIQGMHAEAAAVTMAAVRIGERGTKP